MFKKRDWTKWQHVMFVEDFRAGINTYEILRKVDNNSGNVKYKKVYVKSCVHSLVSKMETWWSDINKLTPLKE